MLLCNPSELRFDYVPPAPPLSGVKLATIAYDLVPLLFPEHYIDRWPGPEYARLYFRGLERIKRYDAFLAISSATRDDFIRHLGIPADRVTDISAASDGTLLLDHARPFSRSICSSRSASGGRSSSRWGRWSFARTSGA